VVSNANEIDKLLQEGKRNRATGETKMNERSSRSHCLFTVIIEQSSIGKSSIHPCTSTPTCIHMYPHTHMLTLILMLGADGEQHIRMGKLNLVDLAGSERQSKTAAEGQVRRAWGVSLFVFVHVKCACEMCM
jgi:hypothetical protein